MWEQKHLWAIKVDLVDRGLINSERRIYCVCLSLVEDERKLHVCMSLSLDYVSERRIHCVFLSLNTCVCVEQNIHCVSLSLVYSDRRIYCMSLSLFYGSGWIR